MRSGPKSVSGTSWPRKSLVPYTRGSLRTVDTLMGLNSFAGRTQFSSQKAMPSGYHFCPVSKKYDSENMIAAIVR